MMGKLIKYEIIKSKLVFFVIGAILGVTEIFYILGLTTDDTEMVGLSAGFLVIGFYCGLLAIVILGLTNYAKDLNEKCGYMCFMTPVSSYKIIYSKFVVALIESFTAVAIFITLGLIDVSLASAKYDKDFNLLKSIAKYMGVGVERVASDFFGIVLLSVFRFLILYSVVFFASSVAAASANSKGGNKFITFFIALALYIVFILIEEMLPTISVSSYSVMSRVLRDLPTIIFESLMSIGLFTLCGKIIDEQISL
ncbi:hypothetical protein SAMN05660484_00820 [Eubacterium ruminantium]|uniref:ABC-2 family transporter protein n=1 Tax=Eubacterium ruminantium TaxID=42322 RepID=A0A1T4LTW7_9FIRM|nr:hypothetical protein [Eubacterium ruminantium]SCW39636.1 hypothetical protein SAMN05660484_00820 [Eubacterium ruminantium]SDM41556.1 hypothetical protein SAMN04490370_10380 [Eubacterium ruminantium]SJZ58097.1 hypothetical protein SAMN02745110_00932 [Eubacterium ruminantium]